MRDDEVGRAIVLRESMIEVDLPVALRDRVTKRYRMKLEDADPEPMEVLEVPVARSEAATAAMLLAEAMLPRKFYAHIVFDDVLFVAYPNMVCIVLRNDPVTTSRCVDIGRRIFDIPEKQMPLQGMFEVDHPNAASH